MSVKIRKHPDAILRKHFDSSVKKALEQMSKDIQEVAKKREPPQAVKDSFADKFRSLFRA